MTTKKIQLLPAQVEFLQNTAKFLLFCAGYGSGKSFLMGFCVVQDAMHSEGATIGVYAPEKKHLRTVAIPAVEHWLNELNIKYRLNKTDNEIVVSTPGIGNIQFYPMDNPSTLVGYQTYRTHIDEFDTLTEDKATEIWDKILGRNRLNPKDIPEEEKVWSEQKQCYEANNKIRVYTTPEGFRFCYKNWVAHPMAKSDIVRGCTEDNPFLPSDYVESLKDRYTPEQLRAYLNGEFCNFNAGTVYYMYDRKKHRSFETVQPNDRLFIGMDFNVYHMSATIYVRRDGGKTWHTVDEIVDARDTKDIIDIIITKYRGHDITVYPDATGTREKTSSSLSDIAQLKEAGFRTKYKKALKSHQGINPLIKDRIAATNKAFENGVLFVNDFKCENVASCLEQQTYDKNGMPDKSSGVDHQNDSTTYPIAFEMPIRKKPLRLDVGFIF